MADARAEALALAESALSAVLAAGATDADATVSIIDRFACHARGDAIAGLERSRSRNVSVRAFVGRRRAALTTSELTGDAMRALAQAVVDAAAVVAPDDENGLAETTGTIDDPDLGTVVADVATRPDAEKVEEALVLERAVRGADVRVVGADGSRLTDSQGCIVLVNSRGFRGTARGTAAVRAVAAVAREGNRNRIGRYGAAARGWGLLEAPETMSAAAARRAVDMLGARKPRTMRVPVIFDRAAAPKLIADVAAACSGPSVASAGSWAAGRCGERIASDVVSIVDDGRLYGGLGTAPFDAEGVPTRRNAIVEDGVLRTYLCDTYYGRRLGTASTGNASGGTVGTHNLFLVPGAASYDDLLAVERGILVVDTIGFATEYGSGIYSRGARGFYIEDGRIRYPVDEFTISSTFLDLLGAIDAVAGDLRFDSTIASPSFRVAEMSVAGT